MRALVVLALLGGCAGPTRPAVLPMLSELPEDPQKRNAVLDSAASQPGPEQRKPLPPKMHKAETAAATAAAVIGSLFSKTQNVTFGALSPVDENGLFGQTPPPSKRKGTGGEGEGDGDGDGDSDKKKASPPVSADRPVDLVPWVQLKEPAAPGTGATPD
jgi:hypothetical protein